jgi:hypothetical protein
MIDGLFMSSKLKASAVLLIGISLFRLNLIAKGASQGDQRPIKCPHTVHELQLQPPGLHEEWGEFFGMPVSCSSMTCQWSFILSTRGSFLHDYKS